MSDVRVLICPILVLDETDTALWGDDDMYRILPTNMKIVDAATIAVEGITAFNELNHREDFSISKSL
jgi:hypothetical protein